jgi:thiol-disulfide isomerase/thioredoxin
VLLLRRRANRLRSRPTQWPNLLSASTKHMNKFGLHLAKTGECAINAGKLLLEVKVQVRHGSFAEWIASHCTFSERTAQLYMQLAKKFPNPQNIADLTLTDLMQMLGPAKLPAIKDERKQKPDQLTALIKKQGVRLIVERAWQTGGGPVGSHHGRGGRAGSSGACEAAEGRAAVTEDEAEAQRRAMAYQAQIDAWLEERIAREELAASRRRVLDPYGLGLYGELDMAELVRRQRAR